MQLTEQQTALFDFVKRYHGDQRRKYSNAPYWTHLWSVAEIVSAYESGAMEREIALCHDLIEDTDAGYQELENELKVLKYSETEVSDILTGVKDLTDVFVHKDYPAFNRKQRKAMEAERLVKISTHAQTVKYADIIDNTTSIVADDEGFARVYLKEIMSYLYKLDKGDGALYQRCITCIENAAKPLKIRNV